MPRAMLWVAAAFAIGVTASSQQQERYVSSTEQLVVELSVDDLDRSITFYRDLGFVFVRRDETFAELSWEGHLFFLYATQPPPDVDTPAGNLRIMVSDVNANWERVERVCSSRSAIVTTVFGTDPDGFGIRFATRLEDSHGAVIGRNANA